MIKISKSVNDTRKIAHAFMLEALQKPRPFIVALEGEIGAGKSEFVRQGLQAMGYQQSVLSPTFTIFNVHEIDGTCIVHADFYRLADQEELLLTGWDDVIERASIVFVEWAHLVDLPYDCCLQISEVSGSRHIAINA